MLNCVSFWDIEYAEHIQSYLAGSAKPKRRDHRFGYVCKEKAAFR